MVTTKHILTLSALLSLFYTGSKLMASTTKNLTHNLKFRVPIEKIGLKINLTQTHINATLEVKNNYYQTITLEGINMTVYLKNPNTRDIEEIASTRPSSKKYHILQNTTTNITDIQVDINNFTLLKNGISNLTNHQKGSKRLKLLISGYANSFPFSTEIWY